MAENQRPEYVVKTPGAILFLATMIHEPPHAPIDPGCYILLSIDDTCCLCRAGEDQNGQICPTNDLYDCTMADLSLFADSGLRYIPIDETPPDPSRN